MAAAAVNSFTPISNTPIDETASAAPAAFKPISNTPIDESAQPRPTLSTGDYLGGLAETGLHFASGAVAPFAGGLTYLSALALTRGDTDAAKAVQQATEKALTYEPRSDTGQALDTAINTLGQATIGKATDFLSDKAADVAGPVGGATARTVLEGAPYALGLGPELSAGRGLVKAVTDRAATVRDMVGAARPAAVSGAADAGAAAAEPVQAPPATPNQATPGTPAAGTAVAAPSAAPAVAPAAGATPTPPPGVAPRDTIGLQAQDPPVFFTGPMADDAEAKIDALRTDPDIKAHLDANPDINARLDIDRKRAATLKEIGLPEVRESAVTGDKAGAATDYQYAKMDHEGGKAAALAFENERNALGDYADRLVADAQGSTGLDETSLYNRGGTIVTPFQELSEAYDHQIKQLYTAADAKAQGMPVDLNNTATSLGNRPAFIATTDGQQLLRGVNSYLRQAGIVDDAGSFGGATVQQAERIKQYLNDAWSPRTSKLIRGIKDAIDDDVAKSAGGDVYQQARAMRAARANLLDNPTGVASLLESSGPNGINRAVNVERIPDMVARMPVDQFNHIIDTLQSVPRELNSKATAALGEIKSQLLLRMQEQAQKYKGNWNNKGVTQYLNSNRMKLARVFTPDELRRITTLNNAGNILDVDRSYPGAAVQGHNLAMRGALAAAPHVASAVVGHLPIVGGAVSHLVGNKVASMIEGASTAKAWQKRMQKL